MARRERNPWNIVDPRDADQHGRAVITTGLTAGKLKISKERLYRVVERVADASVVAQVGLTREWGREASAQVVLLNLNPATGEPRFSWRAFVSYAKLVAERVAAALAQEITILELQSASGAYRSLTFRNELAERQRSRMAIRRAARRLAP